MADQPARQRLGRGQRLGSPLERDQHCGRRPITHDARRCSTAIRDGLANVVQTGDHGDQQGRAHHDHRHHVCPGRTVLNGSR